MADAAVDNRIFSSKQIANLTVAVGFIGVLAIMIAYVPPGLMSMFLVIDIAISLMILMMALYLNDPLEFTTFPTVLLFVTFFRLALNVASTKLILTPSAGVSVQDKAGAVINFFGEVVAGNNAIIGFVVFVILVLIQFIVITKGSGRIAEVAARFTLDAMPGKQMAIDADLNAGLITEADARQRRAAIAQEADFYGAMDGASKFVRGDAIAGIIITAINLIGGMVVGFTEGMEITGILETYTILTIGDGLVSQIPALLVSLAAGIVVSRASDDRGLGENLSTQFMNKPEAMMVASAALFLISSLGMAVSPGIVLPFLSMALLLGGGAAFLLLSRRREETKRVEEAQAEEEVPHEPEKVESLLEVDPMEIEIGFGLISIVDSSQGGDLLDRVSVIRRQTAVELGIIVPPIRIRDNMQLQPRQYTLLIRGIKVAEGEIRPEKLLAMKPGGDLSDDIPGVQGMDPAFGTPAKWIDKDDRSRAEMAGYSVVEPAAVLATHLTEVIKTHASELLGRQEVQQLIDHLKERNEVLVKELLETAGVKVGTLQKVLQNLLRERIPIRNLELIFEAVADHAEAAQMNPDTITEYCRMNLNRIITNLFIDNSGRLPVITIDPNIETRILEGMQRGGSAGILATDPAYAERVITTIDKAVQDAMTAGHHPLILTTPQIRSHLRKLCERRIPLLIVLSYNEVAPDVQVTRIATVRLQHEGEKVSS